MVRLKLFILVLACLMMLSFGCQDQGEVIAPEAELSSEVQSLLKARPRPQTWVDCERFDGVVTPATFNPNSDPFDELYIGYHEDSSVNLR